jgi:predicted nucleic acid-binding protein
VLDRRDQAHLLARSLVARLGRNVLVPLPVAVEIDHLLRARRGAAAARAFLGALATGEHVVEFLTPGLLQRAVELDAQYADLDLGLADTSVMAIAERHDLPVLTFDFAHFRATRPATGEWRLVVDEAQYAESVGRS